jgi:sporulation protein YlmC with PRC-barrel domain
MNDRFSAAVGRKVVSRQSAEELGTVSHLVVDAAAKRVTALVVGKRRRARVVNWDRLSGMGPDAAIVRDDDALHEPADEHEHAAAAGKLEWLGKRALQDIGNELGTIDDVVFDPSTGELLQIVVGEGEHPAVLLRGAGSYAVVLSADRRSPSSSAGPTNSATSGD